MQRRSFLILSAQATASAVALANQPTIAPTQTMVPAGEDRFHQPHNMGITLNNFKVSGSDTQQNLFALEQSFHQKGGPPLHRHPNQDEWFYVIEGQFRIRIGAQELTLHPGDSVLAPRNIPHVWAFVGDATGKILVSFAPAGKMEAFFNAISSNHAMPPQDPKLWSTHDMELLGPPLKI